MKYKSRAIPLHYIKYGESSIIVKLLTEKFGVQSFIVKGVRSMKAKKRLSYFQPMELVNIQGTYNSKNNLQHLNNINLYNYIREEKTSMKKKFLWVFISEVLLKALKENIIDRELFMFVWDFKKITSGEKKLNNCPGISFMISLSKYLGFYPLKNTTAGDYFDLELGEFIKLRPKQNFINKENTTYFKKLLLEENPRVPNKIRVELLINIFLYYELHHHKLNNMSSHKVFESITL